MDLWYRHYLGSQPPVQDLGGTAEGSMVRLPQGGAADWDGSVGSYYLGSSAAGPTARLVPLDPRLTGASDTRGWGRLLGVHSWLRWSGL